MVTELKGEVRLWDSQWVAVVNHPRVLAASDAEEAVAIAVRLTEGAIASNVADGRLPPARRPIAGNGEVS